MPVPHLSVSIYSTMCCRRTDHSGYMDGTCLLLRSGGHGSFCRKKPTCRWLLVGLWLVVAWRRGCCLRPVAGCLSSIGWR